MSVKTLNPRAETMGQTAALFMNINAAKGLLDVMKTNFGPKGTIKMLVSGAGDIKLTKDGNVLLREMQIQNPTAVMIARAAVAQDDVTGDGTTSVVLLIGELLRQAERYLAEGAHPRVIVEGFDIAKTALVEFLDAFKTPVVFSALSSASASSAAGGADGGGADKEAAAKQRELLRCVARTSLRTKLQEALADQLTDIVTDAVLTIRRPDEPLDLYMVEIMHMRHKLDQDTRLVKGLVLDHGARHPDMPKRLDGGVHVLACNLSLEFERPEVNAGFFYGSAEQREKLVSAERAYTDARCQKIIDLKNSVCKPGEGFCVINMKGIDPPCLDMLAKEGILALRRAKRRNMERLSLAFGGHAVSAEEDLSADALGFAGMVYEHVLGEDKYTFVEEAREPRSCTVLIKGPNDHTIAMIKDAVRDGLRAVKNALDDGAVVAGAGAFEIAAAHHLRAHAKKRATGRAKLGVEAFAEALLGSVKVLAENAGYDAQESVIKLQEEFEAQGGEDGGEGGKAGGGAKVGLDLATGEACDPATAGVYDNALVKRQVLNSAPVVASQLLLVDEVMRAGINMRR